MAKLLLFSCVDQLFQEVKEECSTLRKENQNLKELKTVTSSNPDEIENFADVRISCSNKYFGTIYTDKCS